VLERHAVHRWLKRHVRDERREKNLASLISRALVVANRATHKRLVRLKAHHMLLHYAAAGAGTPPTLEA
jgi:hypothetical protein